MGKINILKRYALLIIITISFISKANTNSNKTNNIDYSETDNSICEPVIFDLVDHIKNINVSNNGLNFIKKHESFKSKAYRLYNVVKTDSGDSIIYDGMITIGYGHARPVYTSEFNVGDEITKSKAEILFKKDVKIAENGVKRILLGIAEKRCDIEINQNMFDALVSMAYNMGVRGLATTEFIDTFTTSDDPLTSAELIKTSRIGEWGGLEKRRKQEYDLFISK